MAAPRTNARRSIWSMVPLSVSSAPLLLTALCDFQEIVSRRRRGVNGAGV
jgi:hypothetical protein